MGCQRLVDCLSQDGGATSGDGYRIASFDLVTIVGHRSSNGSVVSCKNRRRHIQCNTQVVNRSVNRQVGCGFVVGSVSVTRASHVGSDGNGTSSAGGVGGREGLGSTGSQRSARLGGEGVGPVAEGYGVTTLGLVTMVGHGSRNGGVFASRYCRRLTQGDAQVVTRLAILVSEGHLRNIVNCY